VMGEVRSFEWHGVAAVDEVDVCDGFVIGAAVY